MNKKLVFMIGLLAVFLFIGGQALAQVVVWGEGAWTDTDVQINIYANIPETEALRSFGVRLIYDPTELTFVQQIDDEHKTQKNEAIWYFGDGTNNEAYMDPTDVEVDSSHRAVIIIGGILDVNDTAKKVSGDRVLLATIWFTRPSGASGPLSSPLTLELGKPDPYKNFVVDTSNVLDGSDVTFSNPTEGKPVVEVYERGDANGDLVITNSDMFKVKQYIGEDKYVVYGDCNKDNVITNSDMFCIKGKI